MQKVLTRLLRFNATIRHLRPQQIHQRIWRKIYRPRMDATVAPPCRVSLQAWCASPIKYTHLDKDGNIILLGQTISTQIENIWQNSHLDHLTQYNLHYHDWLQHPATTNETAQHLMLQWIKANPTTTSMGWDAYCISQRIVNWIKWFLRHPTCDSQLLNSLAQQIRYLTQRLETHLLGNHLLQNAKALLFAGLFFQNSESIQWYQQGLSLWQTQLKQQILADGGHFERSPMYHALALEDLLDVINLHHVYQYPKNFSWPTLVRKMMVWLQVMTHPDGEIAFFNDSTQGVAPRYAELCDYAQRLKLDFPVELSTLIALTDSGYYRISRGPLDLLIDTAPIEPHYQPGHAHADSLSFELSMHGQRIFVNRGINTYENNATRHWQRSTAAHNTLTIDHKNSSDVWKSFRVGKRARILHRFAQQYADDIVITAAHDGFRPFIHQRCWKITRDYLVIVDELKGSGTHEITQYFHLQPQLNVERKFCTWIIRSQQNNLLQIKLDKKIDCDLQSTLHYPNFNKQESAISLKATGAFKLPCTLITEIHWSSACIS